MPTKINPIPWQNRHPDMIRAEIEVVWPGLDYKSPEHLGGGGNGWTVKVLLSHDKHAVLKYYAPSLVDGQGSTARQSLSLKQRQGLMVLEAKTMARFDDQPAGVRIHLLCGSNLAFLMEYLEGGSLREDLTNTQTPLEKLARFLPVLRLLALMQEQGFHHRDIALDNILIDGKGCLRLLDFGFVHHVDEIVVEGWAVKKGGYTHPQAALFSSENPLRHDIQDVYAAVVTLLAWIVGFDPIFGPLPNGGLCGYEPLDKALRPYLQAVTPLPAFGTGIGSFAQLVERLEGLLTKPKATVITTPARKAALVGRKLAGLASLLLLAFLGWYYSDVILSRKPSTHSTPQAEAPDVQLGTEKPQPPQMPPNEEGDPLVSTMEGNGDRDQLAPRRTPQEPSKPPAVLTNTIGMTLVRVPEDQFQMGSDEVGVLASARPARQVVLSSAFYMSQHEVSNHQWQEVMGTFPVASSTCGDCPVTGVSWYEVMGFIEKLNSKEKTHQYRLAREAEWEYVSRANDDTSGKPRGLSLRPVSEDRPNALGIAGLHSNAREWCADWYGAYSGQKTTDPQGPSHGERKVFRGATDRSAGPFRQPWFRGNADPNTRGADLGFRLVRDH